MRICCLDRDERTPRIGAGDADQLLGMRIGERTKDNSVDQAEDRAVGADAQCEGENRDGREAGVLSQRAKTELEVLKQIFHAARVSISRVSRPRQVITAAEAPDSSAGPSCYAPRVLRGSER